MSPESPIAGATVQILGTPLPPVQTDAFGAYSFPEVPEGSYQIQSSAGRCLAPETQDIVVEYDIAVNFALQRPVDAFGYACDDMVAFAWIPGATLTELTGDDETMPLTLPFPFTFYGTRYTTIHVSTNGFGDFSVPRVDLVNVCLPSTIAPLAMVAPFWTDLLVIRPAGVYTRLEGEASNRQFIIEWRDVTFFGQPGNTVTFEIILEEATAAITYQYNRADGVLGDARSATIGIQNEIGTVGFHYSCRESAVGVGKAIRIFRP